jgi:hypothetical protein
MGDRPVKCLLQYRRGGTALLEIENVSKHPLGWTIQELRDLARRKYLGEEHFVSSFHTVTYFAPVV